MSSPDPPEDFIHYLPGKTRPEESIQSFISYIYDFLEKSDSRELLLDILKECIREESFGPIEQKPIIDQCFHELQMELVEKRSKFGSKALISATKEHIENFEIRVSEHKKVNSDTEPILDKTERKMKTKNVLIASAAFLALFIILTSAAVYFFQRTAAKADTTSTSFVIEFNIAELVAALLGGSGLAAAGLGFAVKVLRESRREDD